MAAVRSVRFSSDGQFLVVAEAADFVHVCNTKLNYENRQEIDLFGEMAGVSLSSDDERLYIGVPNWIYSSLLQYNKRHRVGDMNKALMATHIWSLLTNRESLWVKWIHSYRIRGRNFWDVPIKNNVTWSWRKMLNLRPGLRDHMWVKLGDGTSTSVWFDRWDVVCPISSFISPRSIANAGLSLNARVADMCVNGDWSWPGTWITRFPTLMNLQKPVLEPLKQDKLIWFTSSSRDMDFSTSTAWEDLRYSQQEVQWANLVWFPQAIPRHAFLMWLLVLKKLKTQDVMSRWWVPIRTNTCFLSVM
ncbi:putative transcription factor WD40-like family [Helianthus anomalus]